MVGSMSQRHTQEELLARCPLYDEEDKRVSSLERCGIILFDNVCGICGTRYSLLDEGRKPEYCRDGWYVCMKCFKKRCYLFVQVPENKDAIEGKVEWIKC